MATLKVVDLNNKETGSVSLHDEVAQAPLNPYVIKDAVVANMASKRQGTHKAKGRSEVSGARKKLFRQKGTGNARQGYPQAAHRRGGGVVFGPVPRSHALQINKKVKKKALASVISEKIRQNQLVVVDSIKLDSPKTKELAAKLKGLKLEKALIVFNELDVNFVLASRNLKGITAKHSQNLNVYDILNHEIMVITQDALQDVEGRLLK